MAKKQDTKEQALEIAKIEVGTIRFNLVGLTPMIMRRMSQKSAGELLLPKGRKTAADKAASLKHDPIAEYRESPYITESESAPTQIEQLATCFKKAIRNAALDFPGASKAQIGRLVWVSGERVSIYGVPQLHMAIVRSADINRTPDVRTRMIVPRWACSVSMRFTRPLINEQVIANLFAAAGLTQGVGDWRQEKGSGNFGQFRLCDDDDAEFQSVIAEGGRAAQIAAIEEPTPYDHETEELLAWYDVEIKRRGIKIVGGRGA
jgi:hypothetical protein